MVDCWFCVVEQRGEAFRYIVFKLQKIFKNSIVIKIHSTGAVIKKHSQSLEPLLSNFTNHYSTIVSFTTRKLPPGKQAFLNVNGGEQIEWVLTSAAFCTMVSLSRLSMSNKICKSSFINSSATLSVARLFCFLMLSFSLLTCGYVALFVYYSLLLYRFVGNLGAVDAIRLLAGLEHRFHARCRSTICKEAHQRLNVPNVCFAMLRPYWVMLFVICSDHTHVLKPKCMSCFVLSDFYSVLQYVRLRICFASVAPWQVYLGGASTSCPRRSRYVAMRKR